MINFAGIPVLWHNTAKSSDDETGMYQENWVSTMTADAIIMQDRYALPLNV